MNNILLSADTANVTQFGVFEQLTNYGALGLIVLALGAVAWYMFKKIMNEKERLQVKVDELEKELREQSKPKSKK
jgi:biopolymer transport protein ExbB/TolQ